MAIADLHDTAVSEWTPGPLKKGKLQTTAQLLRQGQPTPLIRIAPLDPEDAIWIPFAPSVYKGTGAEPRKNIVFTVPDEVKRQIDRLEEAVKAALRPAFPALDSIWRSSTKPAGQYPASLRGKIWTSGPLQCRTLDLEGGPVEMPNDWASLTCVPLLSISVYVQKRFAGLCIDVMELRLGPKRRRREAQWSFI